MEHTLTVSRLKALQDEWRRHPPLPIMFAAYIGIKPQEQGTPQDLIDRIKGLPGILQT